MLKTKLLVKTKTKIYPIVIGKNLINNFQNILNSENIKFQKCLIVLDSNIPNKFIKIIKKKIISKLVLIHKFKSTEKNKNQKNVNIILNKLLKNNFTREDCLIGFGGGIVGDVSSFVASIFKRGLKFINIPSTLLAQVDSSIGGKTGINNKYGKNLIGSFYQPNLVITDTILLKSLSKRELICGYGEILKHSLISGKKKYFFLEKNFNKILELKNPYIEKAIIESCKLKKKIIEQDEKETSIRKILNLGHTFAHAYEATLGYSKKLNHGEAVILGIKSATKFSLENKILSKKNFNIIEKHISKFKHLDMKKNFKIKNIETILKFMQSDKKNTTSKINLILLKDIGKPVLNLKFNIRKIRLFLRKELIN